MGSFNVACSISSISMGCGTEVVFIPLFPTNYYNKNSTLPTPSSTLIYADCYFTPFCLPIKGKYNDYGALEEIEKDKNVEAIEKMFNISIESFINIIGEQRDFTDSIGEIYKNYAVDKELLKKWEITLNDDIMIRLGFIKNIDGNYIYKDLPYSIQLFDCEKEYAREKAYIIFNKDNETIKKCDGYDALRQLFKDFYEVSNKMLNIKEEDQKRIELLEKMSGMFVHREIYDKLAEYNLKQNSKASSYLTEDIAKSFGFKKVSEEEQCLFDSYHEKLYRKDGYPYDLKIGKYGSVLIHQKYKEYYIWGDKRFGQEIKNDWEKATKTKLEDTFPKVKDIKHLTDEEYKEIKETFKTITGVDMGESNSWDDKYSIYSIYDFKKYWKQATNEDIDISKLEEISKYNVEYDEFRDAILNYKKEKTELEKEIEDTTDEKKKKLLERLILSDYYNNPFSRFGSKLDFIHFYEKWYKFKELYEDIICNGFLKDDFVKYKAFYWSMYSCNRFFFPAMNGEQCGDQKASKILLETSLQIVNDIIKEYEEE